ncbi:hypothetical protein ACFXJ8_13005 [Nonomuraea sp. NPDC059194]|uniref:hypothetical protein n=1 Tax=Nonomuraea sp. NPDC059194 TaxID=3346764 RepID=UPI0036871130
MTRQLRLEIPDDGDIIRQESELRAIRKALDGINGVETIPVESIANPAPGSKNAPVWADAAFWLVVSGSAVKLAATAIREWASVQRNRKVRLTRGDETLEIDGRLDAATAQALEHFIGRDGS